MNIENNSTTSTTSSVFPAHPLIRWGRLISLLGLLLFSLSVMFPIAASIIPSERASLWMGTLDVIIASLFVVLMLIIYGIAHSQVDHQVEQASYRIYRALANLLIVLLIIFLLLGNHIRWEILLPGLTWRLWLLIYILPDGLAAWKFGNLRK